MPRIARPHSPDALAARAAIQAYLEGTGLSVNALALRAGVGQPTLCRFLQGRTKNMTAAAERVLEYMHSIPNSLCIESGTGLPDQAARQALQSAVAEAWDGRPETATVLAHLIRVLGPVLSSQIKDGPR